MLSGCADCLFSGSGVSARLRVVIFSTVWNAPRITRSLKPHFCVSGCFGTKRAPSPTCRVNLDVPWRLSEEDVGVGLRPRQAKQKERYLLAWGSQGPDPPRIGGSRVGRFQPVTSRRAPVNPELASCFLADGCSGRGFTDNNNNSSFTDGRRGGFLAASVSAYWKVLTFGWGLNRKSAGDESQPASRLT